MTGTLRRTVVVTMATLAVGIVLVWAAGTGPAGLVGSLDHPGGRTSSTDPGPVRRAEDEQHRAETQVRRDGSSEALKWLQTALGVVIVVMGLWILAGMLRAALHRVARELPEKRLDLDLEPLPDVEEGRRALEQRQDAYRAALDGGDVRNAIVACWVLLEETAADVGVERRPAETATELVVRFLHALDVDPRPVASLARLYHEARFSTDDLPADARGRARDALAGIRADLAGSAAS